MVLNCGPPPPRCAPTPAGRPRPPPVGAPPGTPAARRVSLALSPPPWPGRRAHAHGRLQRGAACPASVSPRGPGFARERGRRGPGLAARQPENWARGGPRSHEPALTGGGGGAARRPQISEPPHAGGNDPVTTGAPRMRHKPLPGLPGRCRGTVFLRAQGGRTCAKALLKSRGSPDARNLWIRESRSWQLPDN